jgi:hypothetical protein
MRRSLSYNSEFSKLSIGIRVRANDSLSAGARLDRDCAAR